MNFLFSLCLFHIFNPVSLFLLSIGYLIPSVFFPFFYFPFVCLSFFLYTLLYPPFSPFVGLSFLLYSLFHFLLDPRIKSENGSILCDTSFQVCTREFQTSIDIFTTNKICKDSDIAPTQQKLLPFLQKGQITYLIVRFSLSKKSNK